MKRLFCSVIRSERLDTNYCQVQGWKILSSHTFNSPNIPLFEEYGIPVTKKLCSRHVLKMKKGSFHSATQFGSWFLKKISQGARFFTVVHTSSKSLNEAHTNFFQPLNYTFCRLVTFIDMSMYILTGGRTVVTDLLKNVKQGIEHHIDW